MNAVLEPGMNASTLACFGRHCDPRPMADPTPVIDDLCAESEELDLLVAELSKEQWSLPTPAPGWTVAHQIAHLAWTDHASLLAVTDRAAFDREVENALTSPGDFVDNGAEDWAR